MQGGLSEGVLPGLLRELYVGRKTGLLRVNGEKERCGIYFRRGHILYATSDARGRHLSDTLLRHQLLSQGDHDRALETAAREKKRLGLVLQELGLLSLDRLEDAMALQVREVLLEVFSWSDGSYAFEEQGAESPVEEDMTLRVSTGEMILEAVRRVRDPDVVRYALGDIDRILIPSTDPVLRFQKITLTPTDGYVFSRVDGTLSTREVIQLLPVSAEEAQRSLFGLLSTGVIEYSPAPPKSPPRPSLVPPPNVPVTQASERATPVSAPALPPSAPVSLPGAPSSWAPPPPPEEPAPDARRQEILDAYKGLASKDHFEILSIPRASNEAQVKEAYFRLAKRFHPDLHHDPGLIDLEPKLQAVFIRLGEAYEVLRSPRTRAAYESDLSARAPRPAPAPAASPGAPAMEEAPAIDPAYEARLAEESIRRAEKYFEEGKYWDAIQLAELVVPTARPRFKRRGRLVLARCYLKNPHWVKSAEDVLQENVAENPEDVEAFALLGGIYKAEGLKSRAVAMFRKVLDLKPEHEEALAEITGLSPESLAPEGRKGLKKLFGKP